MKRQSNKVSVTALQKDFKILRSALNTRARRVLFYLGRSGKSLEIYLVTNAVMRELNKNFRKKNKVTDVLSFQAPKNFISPKLPFRPLGEIYLAPAVIKNRHEDIGFLMLHGLLHLLGYDHVRKGDMIKMRRKEEFLMKKLNM